MYRVGFCIQIQVASLLNPAARLPAVPRRSVTARLLALRTHTMHDAPDPQESDEATAASAPRSHEITEKYTEKQIKENTEKLSAIGKLYIHSTES